MQEPEDMPPLDVPEGWTCERAASGINLFHRASPFGVVFIELTDAPPPRWTSDAAREGWLPFGADGLVRNQVFGETNAQVAGRIWVFSTRGRTCMVTHLTLQAGVAQEAPAVASILGQLREAHRQHPRSSGFRSRDGAWSDELTGVKAIG